MRTGKISESVLRRSVWKYCGELRPEVLQGAGPGHDSMIAAIGFGGVPAGSAGMPAGSVGAAASLDSGSADEPAVSSGAVVSCAVHPAVIRHPIQVRYALEHAINNLACSGSVPVCALLSVLLPEEAQESDLKEIMEQAAEVCGQWNVQISGGHTEVFAAVREPVLAVTALGAPAAFAGREGADGAQSPGAALDGALSQGQALDGAPNPERQPGHVRTPDGARSLAGMDILVAGEIAREGTALLAHAKERELRARFSLAFVEEAKKLGESICVLKAARIAQANGAAAMHDASQGGIFGALWEMCEHYQAGLDADLRRIPIRQESVEICEYFGLNPYGLLSGGALLIAAPDGKRMAEALRGQGIAASVIGRMTDGNDRILHSREEIRFLDKPAQDEIYKKGADFLWR